MALLQGVDRAADRGLGQMKRFGRARHMLALGHRQEDTKLIEGHAVTLSRRG